MLREVVKYVVGVVVGVVILAMSIVNMTEAKVMGEKRTIEGKLEDVASESGRVVSPRVSYYLPYPGVLPDHKLYFLKVVRDRLRQWSTFGHDRRAALFQLYADKRLNAARFLIEGNKVGLGVETAVKAEKYLERVYSERSQEVGDEVEGSRKKWENLWMAASKHVEVLEELGKVLVPELKPEWDKAVKSADMVRNGSFQKLQELAPR